jgi:tRNA-binding EMAP/Myf-like protein
MSEGMILAAEDETGNLSLVVPEKDVQSGTRLG